MQIQHIWLSKSYGVAKVERYGDVVKILVYILIILNIWPNLAMFMMLDGI